MKFAILCVLSLVAVVSATDGCSYQDLLKCYNLEAYLVNHRFKWPNTDAGVVDLCGKLAVGGKCLKDFNDRCTKKEVDKQLLDAELKALAEYSHQVCDTAASRAQFLKLTGCYSKKEVGDEHFNQHHHYVALVESILATPKDQWVRQVCCADLYARDFGRDTDLKYCDKAAVDYLDNLVKKIFAPRFHHYCGAVSHYKDCLVTLPANIQATFTSIVAAPNPPTKNPFALPTLYQLWKEGGFGGL